MNHLIAGEVYIQDCSHNFRQLGVIAQLVTEDLGPWPSQLEKAREPVITPEVSVLVVGSILSCVFFCSPCPFGSR